MPRDQSNLVFNIGEMWKPTDPRVPTRTITNISNGSNPLSMIKYSTSGTSDPSRVLRCPVEQFRLWIDKMGAKA